MKKFKFRLDNVLKLREFEEYREKIELGKINNEVKKNNDKLGEINDDIDFTYSLLEQDVLSKKARAADLFLHTYFLESYRIHTNMLKNRAQSLNQKYQQQLDEVMKKRNKVKVLNKIKNRDKNEYYHKYLVDESNQLDDIINLRFDLNDEDDL
ncbi:MAG: flagellar FliJ family protein [Oligoflexia bacterium]|nr:flagellar FliJ family protein [Oligoflexia bacterium]